jgi:hypothetical protein
MILKTGLLRIVEFDSILTFGQAKRARNPRADPVKGNEFFFLANPVSRWRAAPVCGVTG